VRRQILGLNVFPAGGAHAVSGMADFIFAKETLMTRPIRSQSHALKLGACACLAVGLSACGGSIAFQGKQAFAVNGSSAPPPVIQAPTRRVNVQGNKITIDEKIQFAHDKATILEASFGLLNEVVQVIKDNPQIKKILIEGHASSEGDKAHNLKLSDDRAKAVMTYLLDHGIAKERLTSKGFGSSDPIADNNTEDGREKNRRVEFTITDPPAGGAK
jgi:outer membrane protein OmpA-like peptidoglycan-associated protein